MLVRGEAVELVDRCSASDMGELLAGSESESGVTVRIEASGKVSG
jgi:hypothetical protein